MFLRVIFRHFLGLYVLIILTLAVASWGQDRLLQLYSNPDSIEERSSASVMALVTDQLRGVAPEQWRATVGGVAQRTHVDLELFDTSDIAGADTLEKLGRGEVAYMRSGSGDTWVLRRIDPAHVLALRSEPPVAQRGPLEWVLTLAFYAAMALVLMFWIWPLTRDLRVLETAAAQYGNRNWRFTAAIKPHSQIYPLAQTFRKMAARIDGLIASHQDMSNAVSHEIKTPLSRMQFEIELAQHSGTLDEVRASLANLKTDIDAIDGLVKATLGYAILERADLSLNLASHDFSRLVPAIAESVQQAVRTEVGIESRIQGEATHVVCDIHLLETVLRNLLYNALRYAKSRVQVTFRVSDGMNELLVEDDGPGIPEEQRARVFQSFVQLNPPPGKKTGYGLGLAIVKRAIEWHGGDARVDASELGGAMLYVRWPASPVASR